MRNLILGLGLILTASSYANGGYDGVIPAKTIHAWLSAHSEYPRSAMANREEGTVYVSFVITDQGQVTNVVVEQGVSAALDNEAVSLVERMPVSELLAGSEKFNATYIVPIRFVIR